MDNLSKDEIALALTILFDLPISDKKELEKVHKTTLLRVYEGVRNNALAYQHLERTQK